MWSVCLFLTFNSHNFTAEININFSILQLFTLPSHVLGYTIQFQVPLDTPSQVIASALIFITQVLHRSLEDFLELMLS